MYFSSAEDTHESSGAEDEQGLSADTVMDSSMSVAVSQLDAGARQRLRLLLRLLPLQLQQPITVQQRTAAVGTK